MAMACYLTQFFGTVASVTTIIGLMPQIYKAYKTKSMEDVSTMMLVTSLTCSVSWVVYGILTYSTYVAISNVICVLTSAISLHQKRKYRGCIKKRGDVVAGDRGCFAD
jgi:MtN3 and saliva related transmembrane protein